MKHLNCANTEGSPAILNYSVRFSSYHCKIITSSEAISGFISFFCHYFKKIFLYL